DRGGEDLLGLAGELLLAQPRDRVVQGDVGAGDRGGAGAAVGLEHVAVEGDGVLAQCLEVDAGAQGPADEARDLVRAPADLAADRLPIRPGVGRAGEHRVFGGHPALAAAAAPPRHAGGDGGGAQHAGATEFDEDGALGVVGPGASELHWAQLIRRALVGSSHLNQPTGTNRRVTHWLLPLRPRGGGRVRAATVSLTRRPLGFTSGDRASRFRRSASHEWRNWQTRRI